MTIDLTVAGMVLTAMTVIGSLMRGMKAEIKQQSEIHSNLRSDIRMLQYKIEQIEFYLAS